MRDLQRIEGWNARVEDVAAPACPYEVGTDEHTAWIGGWISADARFRQLRGDYGEPEERWVEEGERFAMEIRLDPCQEVIDNLAELERDRLREQLAKVSRVMKLFAYDGDGDPQEVGTVRDVVLNIVPDLSGFQASMKSLGTALALFGNAASTALAGLSGAFDILAAAAREDAQAKAEEAAKAVAQAQPKRSRRCPRHGDELVGGGCRRCQREQVRGSNRARR